jgi:hypothetical protein
MAAEDGAIRHDDALAAAGISPISSIDLSGSGILWGPASGGKEDSISHASNTGEPGKRRSYLKGPVQITADCIRFDGPVSRIGSDVTLNARRIVINGIDLTPGDWREALDRIVHPNSTRIGNQP